MKKVEKEFVSFMGGGDVSEIILVGFGVKYKVIFGYEFDDNLFFVFAGVGVFVIFWFGDFFGLGVDVGRGVEVGCGVLVGLGVSVGPTKQELLSLFIVESAKHQESSSCKL